MNLAQARELVGEFADDEAREIDSAIGHDATAEMLSELLGFRIGTNRTDFVQSGGVTALVFRLKRRAPEGVILNRVQIEKIGYEFGLLTKLD